jgi:hypothetical protein
MIVSRIIYYFLEIEKRFKCVRYRSFIAFTAGMKYKTYGSILQDFIFNYVTMWFIIDSDKTATFRKENIAPKVAGPSFPLFYNTTPLRTSKQVPT